MADTYLTKSNFSTPTDSKKGTLSTWFKLGAGTSGIPTGGTIISWGGSSTNFYFKISITSSRVTIIQYSSGNETKVETLRYLRDSTGWYHLCIAFDSTQALASDRVKIHINNRLCTDFYTSQVTPAQNLNFDFGSSTFEPRIGRDILTRTAYWEGSFSHFHWIDGTAYDPSYFGEVDSLTGSWKLTPVPSVNYGVNGFFIFKDGNSVTDQSGNNNDWTVSGGSIITTQDNPSNNFSRMNALDYQDSQSTFSLGNSRFVTSSGGNTYNISAFGMNKGKYYMEAKAVEHSASSGLGNFHIGIAERPNRTPDQILGKSTYSWGYNSEDGTYYNNSNYTSFGNTYTSGDIIGLALDIDNSTLAIYKNGVSQGTISITDVEDNETGFYYFALGENNTSGTVTWEANCGDGYFGQTPVSSAGTNASGNGIFEFDVPTGFTALSTKGLNL
jgi:hypothetical protein